MIKRKAIIAAATLLLALPGAAQTTRKFSANKANEYGLVYTLPVTALDVTIEAERTERKRGEFYKYARKYLGIDPIMEDETLWTLKSVTVNPRGEADNTEENRWLVQLKGGTQPYMMLTDDSRPLSINTAEGEAAAPKHKLPEAAEGAPTPLEGAAARQAMTEEMLQARSTAKRAELAAAKIYELRQYRNDIISGQADAMPADGKAMQLALEQLERQEAALTAMFAGAERKSTAVRTVSYVPERATAAGATQESVVARLSATDGIVDSSDLSGAPITLSVTALSLGEMPVNEKGQEKTFPKGGLAYRIPGRAAIEVGYNGKRMFADETNLAQLGIVFGLDPGLFTDKKAPAYARFDPTTGAIVEMGTATPAAQ